MASLTENEPENKVNKDKEKLLNANGLTTDKDTSTFADRQESSFESDIAELLKTSSYGSDFLWSLFVAAARSYRFSSILHPFPPMYHSGSDEDKNMFAMRDAISRVGKLSAGQDYLSEMPDDCKELLSWVILTSNFRLKMRDKESYLKRIKEWTGQIMDTADPSYIFEVVPGQERARRFEQLRGTRNTFYAYHGSRLDNFYSILHNGLNSHLNKVSVFGEGTYLSSELSVSLIYSQAGEGWKQSSLGTKLSCVAVCEMIDDPSVKCQVKDGTTTMQKKRAQASKITDAVPEKYYVVQNNDVIRVKYLLVYREKTAHQSPTARTSSYSWLRDHKFPLLMLAYVLLLAAIGIANSRFTINSLMRFYKSIKLS